MLNIALLGACPIQQSELGATLQKAIHALGCQTIRVTAAGADALPTGLPGFDLVLLAGLEAPFPGSCPDGQDAETDPQSADHLIRTTLARAGVSYRVLYGTAGERLAYAVQAIESLLPATRRPRQTPRLDSVEKNQPWVWMCDKCSDPQCEHRLLTSLLAERDSAASTPGQQARPLLNG